MSPFVTLLDPVVLFFILGIIGGLAKSDLKLPDPIFDSVSIFLLLAIGLKGGIHLSKGGVAPEQLLGVLSLGVVLPLIAFQILRWMKRFPREDCAALAAHYGSVSAVTFAVVLTFLETKQISYEPYVVLFMVLLEIPAIAVGIFLANSNWKTFKFRQVGQEIVFNKSIFLLLGGLLIGWISGPERMEALRPVFFTGFKAALAFFLLEMGAIATKRMADLRKAGVYLASFAIGMPLLSSVIGAGMGMLIGLSFGGTVVLATLAASASYIAAPAAVRIAIPSANPTLYLTAALGVTFPFNVTIGIPVYFAIVCWMRGM